MINSLCYKNLKKLIKNQNHVQLKVKKLKLKDVKLKTKLNKLKN